MRLRALVRACVRAELCNTDMIEADKIWAEYTETTRAPPRVGLLHMFACICIYL